MATGPRYIAPDYYGQTRTRFGYDSAQGKSPFHFRPDSNWPPNSVRIKSAEWIASPDGDPNDPRTSWTYGLGKYRRRRAAPSRSRRVASSRRSYTRRRPTFAKVRSSRYGQRYRRGRGGFFDFLEGIKKSIQDIAPKVGRAAKAAFQLARPALKQFLPTAATAVGGLLGGPLGAAAGRFGTMGMQALGDRLLGGDDDSSGLGAYHRRRYGRGSFLSVLGALAPLAGPAVSAIKTALQGTGSYSRVGTQNVPAFMGGVGAYRPRAIRGRGAYDSLIGDDMQNPESITQALDNAVTMKQEIPTIVNASEGQVVIRHREYVADIVSVGQAFLVNANLRVNPGLSVEDGGCFSWLSGIAQHFQMYRFDGITFEYVSTSGTNASTQALGEVMMSTNYNCNDGPPATKGQMLNQIFSGSKSPAADFTHAIETDPAQSFKNGKLLIRGGSLPQGANQLDYDFCETNIATQGQVLTPGNTSVTLGELWVTYQVSLYKPQLPQVQPSNGIGRMITAHWSSIPVAGPSYQTGALSTPMDPFGFTTMQTSPLLTRQFTDPEGSFVFGGSVVFPGLPDRCIGVRPNIRGYFCVTFYGRLMNNIAPGANQPSRLGFTVDTSAGSLFSAQQCVFDTPPFIDGMDSTGGAPRAQVKHCPRSVDVTGANPGSNNYSSMCYIRINTTNIASNDLGQIAVTGDITPPNNGGPGWFAANSNLEIGAAISIRQVDLGEISAFTGISEENLPQ